MTGDVFRRSYRGRSWTGNSRSMREGRIRNRHWGSRVFSIRLCLGEYRIEEKGGEISPPSPGPTSVLANDHSVKWRKMGNDVTGADVFRFGHDLFYVRCQLFVH